MADLTANRITNDANIIKTQIQQKTDDGMKAIRPETDTDIVINNSTNVTGDTVTDAFDSALPIIAGQNISITPGTNGVTIGFTGSLAPNVKVQSDPNVSNNPITVSENKNNTSATYTVGIKDASTSQKGAVQLSDSTSSESSATAATSKAVKDVYDFASGKQTAFADGSATIATAKSGTITIKAGVSQSGGTISNSSDNDVSTYTAAQIDSLVAGLTKYLGTATKSTDLTSASTANAGDFFRVTTQFSSSNWGTAHVGDLVILKKDAAAEAYATLTNWEIIHTGDNTSYGVVSTSADGLAPKITTTAGQIDHAETDRVLVSKNGATPKWQTLPANAFKNDNTTYTIGGDGVNKVYLYENGSSTAKNTVVISDVPHASSADSATTATTAAKATEVANALTVQFNGTNQFTYNGSEVKTLNITASGIGAAASSHTHGYITNDGRIGSPSDTTVTNTSKIVITDGKAYKITRSSITFDGITTTQALTPAGTWASFIKGVGSGTNTKGETISSTFGSDGIATLGDSGVTPGVYCALQVNSKGIVTAGAHVIKIYENGTTIGPELVTGGFAFIKI